MVKLTREDFEKIAEKAKLTGDENLAVVAHKNYGRIDFSVHVFERAPMPKEMINFEETSGRVKIRGNRAEVEGSNIKATMDLYKKLISRVYDLPVGFKQVPQLDRDKAIAMVPPLVMREAIREFLGSAQGATSYMEEQSESEVTAPEGD